MSKSKQQTAAQAYAARVRRIESILGWLPEEIDAHAAKHKASPGDWGLVGDMTELESQLKQALSQIAGMEPRDIDQTLDDDNA